MNSEKEMIELKAYAKVNLSLYITGVRRDGYHLLDSVFVPVSLHDTVKINKSTSGIKVNCNAGIPNGPENTAYKAASLLMDKCGFAGVMIDIDKHIPHMAGLGGGSSDAAAVLMGINELYGLKLSQRELLDMAAKIGADVPFFLREGSAKVTGIGERIEPLNIKTKLHLVILKPERSLSTPKVFKEYDTQGIRSTKDSRQLTDALRCGDIDGIAQNLGNDLQPAAQVMCPQIGQEISWLIKNRAKAAIMTGSGSCVFGIYESAQAAQETCRSYVGGGTAYAVHTVDKPIEVIRKALS